MNPNGLRIENVHTNLKDTIAEAIRSEAYVNNLSISDEEKSLRLTTICSELDENSTFLQLDAEISGIMSTPTFGEGGDMTGIELMKAIVPERGTLKGFGVSKVPVVVEGFPMGDYFYICHSLYTHSTERGLEDGSVEQRHYHAYFPVQHSKVRFIGGEHAHDINELRYDEHPMLETIDRIAMSSKLDLSQKLHRLDDLFGRWLPILNEEESQQFLSYVNSLGIVNTGFQPVLAEYAIMEQAGETTVIVPDDSYILHATITGLRISDRYRVKNQRAVLRKPGLGLAGYNTHPDQSMIKLTFPLNQLIVLDEVREA
jgi:hypothetical protein